MWKLSKENEAKIPEWNKRWVEDVVLRTKPMTPQEKLEVEIAIRAMYRLSGLDGDNLNVVFVRSPMVASVVAEAALTYCRKKYKSRALYSLYYGKFKFKCTTGDRESIDTFNAIFRGTHHVTSEAVYNSVYNAIDFKRNIACVYLIKNNGNFVIHDSSYLSFVRDIIGFKCEEQKNYKHYETCTKLSSRRYMHEKFCVISDFPIELHNYLRNGRLVAHNEKGPSHLWADGSVIWTINGIAVTEQIVMRPETLTIKQIDKEKNEEVKRIMIDRFTWARYLTETNAKCLDARTNDVDGTSEALMVLKDKSVRLLCACKSTARVYTIRVNKKIKTCQEAQSWMAGDKKNIIGVS